VSGIDWLNTPLHDFLSKLEKQEDGTNVHRFNPLGEGEAQRLMVRLLARVSERKERERLRAKERRKLKKLGEW
jgi:hypothetical protein